MATKGNTSSTDTRSFDKSLQENLNDFHLPKNSWTQARNAINNSVTGDLGKLGNEPGNLFCTAAPYTVIGIIHLIADKWLIYSTDNTDSEIGIFEEDKCLYTTVVNDPCLGFKKDNLIIGVARQTSTCTFNAYWDDALNVSRYMKVTIDTPADNVYTNPNSPVPWIQNCTIVNDCRICVNTNRLDCDAIRLAKYITPPCVEVKNGAGAGTLLNGSYMVAIAYAVAGQKVSDWYLSNVQPLFAHSNAASSLDVDIISADQDFDEMLVAVVSVTNQQAVARLAGTYNTRQKRLSFDTIDNTWIAIPIEELPIMTPIANKSDAMYNVNDLLLRVGPTSKEDFNYQPLANQIVAKWQSVEYPADYYRKGGNKTNYLRDEIYPFFIRWVYDTGDKSSSYHIPGRPAGNFWTNPASGTVQNDFLPVGNSDGLPETTNSLTPHNWVVYNTAKVTNFTASTPLPDGGIVVAEGLMGYWESTEKYPDDKPQIWDANINTSPYSAYGLLTNPAGITLGNQGEGHDLCGKQIRHHRFPDIDLDPLTRYYNASANAIRIMGVKFENIQAPLMNNGQPVPGIIGYEILRGARNGNKTILAKGLLNNMRTYTPLNGSGKLGLFPNYPYNEVGRPDPFLTEARTNGLGKAFFIPCPVMGGFLAGEKATGYTSIDAALQRGYSQQFFTFHSPDTNFTDPYLSAKELKIHGEMNGDVLGKFEYSEEHPKEKLLTNTAFFISAVAGVGLASLASNGQRTVKYIQPTIPGYSQDGLRTISGGTAIIYTGASWTAAKIPGSDGAQPKSFDSTGITKFQSLLGLFAKYLKYDSKLNAGDSFIQNIKGDTIDSNSSSLEALFRDFISGAKEYSTTARRDIDQEDGQLKNIPNLLRFATKLPLFFNYFTQGTDTALELFRAIARYRDFALRYHSHCFYNRYVNPRQGNTRFIINNQQYIGPQMVNFGLNARINNVYRSKTVALDLARLVLDTTVNDVTRVRASDVRSLYSNDNFKLSRLVDPTEYSFGRNSSYMSSITPGNAGIQIASSHYASLKQRIRNQYGQINGVQQIPTGACVQIAPRFGRPISSETIFGGDTYLGRYTEKNTFFFFYNWLYDQPDGAQFDYSKNEMIPYPRYWANFDQFEISDFTSSVPNFLNPLGGANFLKWDTLRLPSNYYNLDGFTCVPGSLKGVALTILNNMRISIKDSYFYLFSSGVKDFFVESEYNVDLRDWDEAITQQHYDSYRFDDTKALFDTKIIKTGNYYKYDPSLSISRIFLNYTSWAAVQTRNYDPFLAETCFIYLPKRLIYSLPAQFESLRDNWLIFLANNYGDFNNKITGIKSVNKSGALIFFDAASPVQFLGLDQLQTTSGTKLTIGDGGLFTQPPQNVVNADASYEYGSCQNRLSIINTPAGLFWMSQNQGKIFQFGGNGIKEISMTDMKWWYAAYLPYRLTEQFSDFELTDNPVIGIGCQAIYDNENALLYFTKKDYIVRQDLPANITLQYVNSNQFTVLNNNNPLFNVALGDTRFFEDASWTTSYDPKTGGWIGYHDWHPTLMMPGKNTFLTILDRGLWIHNERCDLYCNYYGVDYPFEVEYMVNTIQTVNSLRSVEYILECYKYAPNCYDRFHVLDFNFDEAVIYNTEQVSGLLRLVLQPKNDPQAILNYPQINFSDIDIAFTKEEQKYRFDQFWDITRDRGEYNPNAQRMIWNTAANGYVRVLNPNNLNYTKDEFERKKFRHYTNTVFLRRRVSGDRKMLVLLTNNKNLYSPR